MELIAMKEPSKATEGHTSPLQGRQL